MKTNRLNEILNRISSDTWPERFTELVREHLGIDLETTYGPRRLSHPVMVAPGQLTLRESQVMKIKRSGYAGCVLKSLVGEDQKGHCSMSFQRKKATWINTVYAEHDQLGRYPIIHWDGRADTRNLEDYLVFAKQTHWLDGPDFFIAASLLCHLPGPDEEFRQEEWHYSTKGLKEAGYQIIEIDFCPSLKIGNSLSEKENVLRWYRTVPGLIKYVDPTIKVFPKLLNLDLGLDFQLEMAQAAVKGGADGLVVANRIFLSSLQLSHGGLELFQRNLTQVKEIHRLFPNLSLSATGGIYSGRQILEYLLAGAKNVQLFSFLMGRVRTSFLLKTGHKFQQVLFELFFNPEEGLLVLMIKKGFTNIRELLG
ncbi:MAG: hypothetical protein NC911_02545 [Candidatus Omnitrophica bacterium]|nr:hypothetical protein [Candidatus Omnitrophota bacterium]